MTKQEKVEQLQGWIQHNVITTCDELNHAILEAVYDTDEEIDPYEDVILPLGMNTCDRCGDIYYSEELFWIDGFDWEDDNPDDVAIQRGIAKEEIDYCAICYSCLDQLKMKGKQCDKKLTNK